MYTNRVNILNILNTIIGIFRMFFQRRICKQHLIFYYYYYSYYYYINKYFIIFNSSLCVLADIALKLKITANAEVRLAGGSLDHRAAPYQEYQGPSKVYVLLHVNILLAVGQDSSLMMVPELLLPLLPALVLLCHHLGRLRLFAGLEEVQEVLEVEAHRVYLAHRAHLDPHPAHYMQFHPDPDPDPDLKLHLHLVLPWYQLNQLIGLLYKPV